MCMCVRVCVCVCVCIYLALHQHGHVQEHVVKLTDASLQFHDLRVSSLDLVEGLLGYLGVHFDL